MLTLATQDQAERRETTSRAIGGPVSGLVDQTKERMESEISKASFCCGSDLFIAILR